MSDYVRALLGRRRYYGGRAEVEQALSAREARIAADIARRAAVDLMRNEDRAVPLLEGQLERNREMREHVARLRARTVGEEDDKK